MHISHEIIRHQEQMYSQSPRQDFSWDEMAAFDLPAVADYIAKQTASSSLAYVGHSQGTTAGLAALASKETFAARVRG